MTLSRTHINVTLYLSVYNISIYVIPGIFVNLLDLDETGLRYLNERVNWKNIIILLFPPIPCIKSVKSGLTCVVRIGIMKGRKTHIKIHSYLHNDLLHCRLLFYVGLLEKNKSLMMSHSTTISWMATCRIKAEGFSRQEQPIEHFPINGRFPPRRRQLLCHKSEHQTDG